jgi:hypothetical protein
MKNFTLLSLLITFALSGFGQTSLYWINGGTANFTDGTHWSYSSGGAPIGGTISWTNTHIARFDANSGSPTVTVTSSETIGRLQISGSITVTFSPPTGGSRNLTIRAAVSDALTVATGSSLNIRGNNNRDMTVQLFNASGIIASINGNVKVFPVAGNTGIGQFEKGSSATINFNSGSLYEHGVNGDALPVATWNASSTCLVTGVTDNIPSNTDQTFGNFTWNCPGQSQELNFAGNLYDINGNLSILGTNDKILRLSQSALVNMDVAGNFIQNGNTIFVVAGTSNNTMTVHGNFVFTGGSFYLCTTTAYPVLNIRGNFTMTDNANIFQSYFGTSNYSTVNFNGTGVQTFTRSSGTMYYRINFYVRSGSTLDMGSSVLGDYLYTNGTFTLESGAGLKTTHSQGIVTSGNAGCVRVSSTRSYHSNANYTFYRNGTQSTGTGLQTTLSGILTIGSMTSATGLTLTNSSVAINNKLILISSGTANSSISSGTVTYGSTGTLEYQGNSLQTTTSIEFPSISGPFNVRINNPNDVSLFGSRTINGTLYLEDGEFIIGNNILTLNGSTGAINVSGGTLTGGNSSDIVFSGTGSTTSLPPVELRNLTISRASGISLGGDVLVSNLLTLSSGNFNVGNFTLTLNGPTIAGTPDNLKSTLSSKLVFGGSSSGIEIPSSITQLHSLTINNPTGVKMNSGISVGTTGRVYGYLNCSTFVLSGSGSFTLYSGGKVGTSHANGIAGSIAMSGLETFNSGADFLFNGSVNQSTNFPSMSVPGTFRNLFIHNTASAFVSLVDNITLTGNLTIQANSHFSVSVPRTLSVFGTTYLIGPGCFKLKADETGGASFIDNGITYNNEASVIAERFISRERWHYVSSPVTDEESVVYLDLYLKQYNEPGDQWQYIVPTNIPMTPGKGYASWSNEEPTGDRTIFYEGELNTGNVICQVTATDRNDNGMILPEDHEGWNLVGNPYPSAIDWNLIDPGLRPFLDGTVYVYDGTQYLCYPYDLGYGQLVDGIIPAQQAFFVHANDFNPELTIPQIARLHGFSPYKNSEKPDNLLELVCEGNSYSDKLIIHFRETATTGFDKELDAYKWKGIEEAPQLYAITGVLNLAIDVLPFDDNGSTVQLGIEVGAAGNYTLKASGCGSFDFPDNIYLEDKLENAIISLSSQPEYSFYTDPLMDPLRFSLHFNYLPGIPETLTQKAVIGIKTGQLTVEVLDNDISEAAFYSITGQNLYNWKLGGTGVYVLEINQAKGIYIFKLIGKENLITQKIFIP